MEQKINIIILGDGSVGKTSILQRYADKEFQDVHIATLGLDYKSLDFNPKCDPNKTTKAKIWDTAG